MRVLIASALVVFAVFAAGCEVHRPPIAPDPPSTENALAVETKPDETPHVVRRLVAEAQEQLDKDRQMATELPDSGGRARAQDAVDFLATELASLASRIDDADSANLDDVMKRLSEVSTRIDDLHDRLRVATERVTAVAP